MKLRGNGLDSGQPTGRSSLDAPTVSATTAPRSPKIVKEAQLASEPEALASWIGEQDGSITAIGLEAGPLSQWLHRGLSEAGLDVVLMELGRSRVP
jgi:transposase